MPDNFYHLIPMRRSGTGRMADTDTDIRANTKTWPSFVGLVLLTVAALHSAYAHNVVSIAYTDGMLIEGEIGFSSGVMAEAGTVVAVLNDSGDKLGETSLEEGGVFSYRATSVQKHVLKADLSAGHIAEMIVEADELSQDSAIPLRVTASSAGSETAHSVPDETVAADAIPLSATELQAMIRSTVAQQVRPLQKELRAYKEQVMFRDIAGGLGFIFGLFGVAAWMVSKRKDADR